MQLIETGKKIIRRRKQFVDELRVIVSDIHYRISGGKEELFLKYEPNIDDIFFEDELSRAKEKGQKALSDIGGTAQGRPAVLDR